MIKLRTNNKHNCIKTSKKTKIVILYNDAFLRIFFMQTNYKVKISIVISLSLQLTTQTY